MSGQTDWVFDETVPSVIINVTPKVSTDEDLERYLARWDEFYRRGQPFLSASFVRAAAPNREHSRRISAWMKANSAKTTAFNKGTAFITNSTIFRFVLSGVFLVQPLENAYETFSDVDKAELWMRDHLRACSLPVADNLGEALRKYDKIMRAL